MSYADHLERAATRPRSATTERPPAATGRERTKAWRLAQDRRRAPEADVVGIALLASIARDPTPTRPLTHVVNAAIDDLVARGFSRREIERVFKRWRKRVKTAKST